MENTLKTMFSLSSQPSLFKLSSELAVKFEREQTVHAEYLTQVKRINSPLLDNNRKMDGLKKTLATQ